MVSAGERKEDGALKALNDAVRLIGGQAAMARLVGVKQPSVWRWLKLGKPLPGEYVLKVEEATAVSRHDLRPDLYPRTTAEGASNPDASRFEAAR